MQLGRQYRLLDSSRSKMVLRRLTSLFRSEAVQDAAGIVVVTAALLIYGVLQERIMTVGFGPGQSDHFDNSIFLLLCNRLCTCMLAFVYIACTQPDIMPAAPFPSYAYVSFGNVIATSCQYEALKYVSFAIQTLSKSAKAMPVMMWGSMYSGKRYKAADYGHAIVITLGCTIFITTGEVTSRTLADRTDLRYMLVGMALMMVYLAVDGLTSTWQDGLFKQYNMGICDQVLFTTMFSTGLSFVASLVTGQLTRALSFLLRHPEAVWWILALSLAAAVVQLVISFTIKRFGAVVFATIMTTRQFFSVLLSCFIIWTPLTLGQWFGVMVVFGVLYYKILLGGSKVAKAPAKALAKQTAAPLLPVISTSTSSSNLTVHP